MKVSRKWHGSDADLDALIAAHGDAILRVARRYSENAADAEDAFQRTIEALLTKPPADDVDLLPWLKTVVRNEALMIRRKQSRIAATELGEATGNVSTVCVSPEEATLDAERIAQGREALKRLTPDQTRCMLLRADGMSYDEIAGITGFSFAKVQRSLWSGRKAFHAHVERSERGDECRRIEPLISAYVDGAASDLVRRDVELHVENCLACKAMLRDFRAAPGDLAAAYPLGVAVAQSGWLPRPLGDAIGAVQSWIGERFAGQAAGAPVTEIAFAKKAAAITAIAASAFAGGAAVERVVDDGGRDRGGKSAQSAASAPESVQLPAAGEQGEAPAGDERDEPRATASDILDAPASDASSPRQAAPRTPASDTPAVLGDDGAADSAPAADEPVDEPLIGGGE